VTNPTPPLQELAEDPDYFLNQIPLPVRRILTPRATVLLSPSNTYSTTLRVRATAETLDDTIADARRVLRAAGFLRNVWHVGPSSRPEGLERMLLARGFVPPTRGPSEPSITAMALTAPPAISPASTGIEVRLVRNIDEYREVIRIAMEVFNESPEDAAGWFEAVPSLWASQDGVNRYTHMAFLDGRLAGFGFAATCDGAVLLGGSGVLELARGRGVYRALVAARWDEAVKQGHRGLIVQAGAMSRPILARCGFEVVCEIAVLEDMGLVPD
jgi:GNAT superfamily N-acetyltransferase